MENIFLYLVIIMFMVVWKFINGFDFSFMIFVVDVVDKFYSLFLKEKRLI